MFSKSAKHLRHHIIRQFASIKKQFTILDIKNDHLVYVQDPQGSLPFMREIVTSNGQRGIVLKLQEKSTSVIGFYHNIQPTRALSIQQTKSRFFQTHPLQLNKVYDIDEKEIGQVKDVSMNPQLRSEPEQEGKRIRLPSTSPILSSCYNMFYGDFNVFCGSLGSGRTRNALSILNFFVHQAQSQNIGIYLNTNASAKRDCLRAASSPNALSFGRSEERPLSSVGIYMLSVKCLQVAKKYKSQGKNVLLVVDNINEILANEWSIIQNLNLPISPISLLNQLYSASDYPSKGMKKGSITTLGITSMDEGQTNTMQQVTTYSNNPKHLRTISQHIEYPLKPTFNYHMIENKKTNSIRQNINRLLKQKKQSELVRKLKLDKDQPWEYYYILDSDWWMNSLKVYNPSSIQERDLFLWFINKNIQNDLCAYWTIPSLQAYHKYLEYLGGSDFRAGVDDEQFENFMHLAKMEGHLSVYKKDYLQ